MSVNVGQTTSTSRSDTPSTRVPPRHPTGSVTTAATAPADRYEHSAPGGAPQTQPACLTDAPTGPHRLRELEACRRRGRCPRRGLRRLHRPPRARRPAESPEQTARSHSWSATTRATRTFWSPPRMRRGRPTTTTGATASTTVRSTARREARALTRRRMRCRTTGPSTARSSSTAARRTCSTPSTRWSRFLRRTATTSAMSPTRRLDAQRLVAHSTTNVHHQRPRRVLVGRSACQRTGCAQCRRQPGVLQRQRHFWKTRWAASADGSNTPTRTLITYKETHFNGADDPAGPADLDRRLAGPALQSAGGRRSPTNALTGQLFVVNSGTSDITVHPSTQAPDSGGIRLPRG